MPEPQAFMVTCPLCGQRFSRDCKSCADCLMGGSCDRLCCPSCGYSFVDGESSAVVGWLKKLLESKKEQT